MNYDKINADFEAQKAEILATQEDFDKFCHGNDAAGVRFRKSQQKIKNLSKDLRLEVSTIKHAAR